MPTVRIIQSIVIAIALATGSASAKESAPTVYQDDYVTVRAGIIEAGTQAVHMGDTVSLVVDIEFDARQVQIENPDDDLLQRAFAGMPSVRLYEPGNIATQTESGDQARIMSHWRLQILDCPEDMANCPGNKIYELPIMTVSYQLAGSSADSRSARFRPWPGTIVVAPAIAIVPETGTDLTDVLPGGAYAKPQPIAAVASSSSMLLLAGALLFATGFLAAMRRRHPELVAVRPHHADSRWEHALVRLRDNALPDDEWADLLRRCLTWYCIDELGRNPYTWLGAAASDTASGDESAPALRRFFLDVLHQHGVDQSQRGEFFNKLLDLTGQADNVAMLERST